MLSFVNSTRPPSVSARSASTGSTALQGPHQGAQKSTTTGRSARTTSASNVSSSTSRMPETYRCRERPCPGARHPDMALEAAEQSSGAERRHLPDRLEHDPLAHLGAADLAIGERDRNLDDPKARSQGAVRGLDLERVAERRDAVQVDRLQHFAPVALEAAGQVADAELQEHLGVERAPTRDEAANEPPVPGAAALDVPGAEHEIRIRGRRGKPRHVRRVMREVAVHFEDK